MDSLTIEPELESRTSLDFDSAVLLEVPSPTEEEREIVIDDNRTPIQFSIMSHESIYDKWREKLVKDVEIIVSKILVI